MTREEAKNFLIDISYKLGNMAIEYLSEKDGEKMREAIKVLEQELYKVSEYDKDHIWYKCHQYISLRRFLEVKKALKQESCDDTISRQAVLDDLSELNAISFYEAQEDSKETYYEIRNAIKQFPPAKIQEPCEDAISRQAMLEIQAKYAGYMGATKFWQMRDEVKALPPVTPQPKTGHWIPNYYFYGIYDYTCSECEKHSKEQSEFCSKCGTKMIESQERSDKE